MPETSIPGPGFAGTGWPGRPPGFPSARSRCRSRWTTGSGSRRRCTCRMRPARSPPSWSRSRTARTTGRCRATGRSTAPSPRPATSAPARHARHGSSEGTAPASIPSARSSTTWRSSSGWRRGTGAPAGWACSGSAGVASALQAAWRPPALRAIIPVHFSHDRYNLDVHYVGGTLHVARASTGPWR